nr:MAG TPA: Bromelain inhibitor VI [Caudoviricetes sp.]
MFIRCPIFCSYQVCLTNTTQKEINEFTTNGTI